MNLKQLLQATVELNASDLHLISGILPTVRIDGELHPIAGEAVATPETTSTFLKEILTGDQLTALGANKEIDFSMSFSDVARFRVNVYTQKNAIAAAFRVIPLQIPTIEGLDLPKVLHSFTSLRQGLVLVTGPTGHGKSSTLAAIINEINVNRAAHILTIEDPIEYIYPIGKSLISQR